MLEIIKKALKESGELMVKTEDGVQFELHLHNTSFDDKNELIIIETGVERYWIPSQRVVYYWIHRKAN